MIKVRWPVRDSNRVDFDFEVLRVLVSVCSGQRGWVWNVLVVRLRYIRWMLLGWLRVFGSTGYNLFLFDVATSQGAYIATATSLTVQAVPAPGALALLAAAGASFGVGGGRRRRE